jgi:hypothetical protein
LRETDVRMPMRRAIRAIFAVPTWMPTAAKTALSE